MQVVADDDAHVLELQPLRRVYAAGLVHGSGAERERLPAVEVPADLEVADLDVVVVRVGAARPRPVPAVPGQDARTVGLRVALQHHPPHLLGRVDHRELVVDALDVVVRRLPDAEHVVQPREVAVGPVAPELRDELLLVHLGLVGLGPVPYRVHAAYVLDGDPLALVDEEDVGCDK